MIIALSQSMGMEVSAEGVENKAQLDCLEGMGCHMYQGYLFSRPLPVKEFEMFARHVSESHH
jgi:EAL domain-containing protein (putative c-di-GMP-specific phosphodiesterase class I)